MEIKWSEKRENS